MNPCRLLKLIVSVVFFVTPSLGNTNQTSAKELSASIRNDLQPIVEYAKRTQKSERLNTILAGLDSLANDGDSPNDVYQTFLRRIANDSTLQNILATGTMFSGSSETRALSLFCYLFEDQNYFTRIETTEQNRASTINLTNKVIADAVIIEVTGIHTGG